MKDSDYISILLSLLCWIILGTFAQCESTRGLDDINRELSEIRHELNMLRYNHK